MTKEGRLTKVDFGYAMPVDAPLFAKPPIYYKYAEAICVDYETEQEAALDLLPEGLELPLPPKASLLLIKYPFSTFGPYEEAILSIYCTWRGEMRRYVPHIVVNSDIPQAAGREIWGFPKKLADIAIIKEADMIWGKMERPQGNRICSAGVRPERQVEIEQADVEAASLCLRVIPSPEEEAEPSVAELVEVYTKIKLLEIWQGAGWIQYDTVSTVDPWHKIGVKKVLDATYRIYHLELGYGKIIKRY